MCCNDSCTARGCGCVSLLISAVATAVVAFLFFSGLITNIVTVLWIIFGLAVLSLIFLVAALLTAGASQSPILSSCLCRHGTCLLAGIFGTLLSSIIALAFTLTTGTFSIIIVALTVFFAFLLLTSIILLFRCIICGLCSVDTASAAK